MPNEREILNSLFQQLTDATLMNEPLIKSKFMDCSADISNNHKELTAAIAEIIGWVTTSLSENLLSLRKYLNGIEDPFKKELLTLTADGMGIYIPYFVKPLLLNSKCCGEQFVETLIYAEGMIMLSYGLPVDFIKMRLNFIVGNIYF